MSPPRIAYQGIPGAFSELAVAHWWPAAHAIGCVTFADAIARVVAGDVVAAAIPVHNRIAGPVEAARAALAAAGDTIVITDEVEVPVELCLMVPPGGTREGVRVVWSHPMALAQCRPFLDALAAQVRVHDDTAGAARDVREAGDPTHAAIAAERAALAYGLQILARGIQAAPDNRTRFVRVERAG
jgi:prephenate dehydratase